MGIWGKIVGGAAGFAIGGPIGAIVGVAAGHFIDRATSNRQSISNSSSAAIETKQQAFAIALIVLCAKMAKADGQVTRDEIAAFKRVFKVPEKDMGQVAQIFDKARKDSKGFEPYAEQITEIFPENRQIRQELLGALLYIAQADGVVHEKELKYLRAISKIFDFDEKEFEQIYSSHLGTDDADPYEILGLDRTSTDEDIKLTYRKLVRENHPDRLIAEGLPKEMVDMANEKLARINSAYDRIAKLRGIK